MTVFVSRPWPPGWPTAPALYTTRIWFGRPWSGVFKGFGDALIYALLTGGAFGWLWPEMA